MVDPGLATIIVVVVALGLLFLGAPIFIALLASGGLGIFLIAGPRAIFMINIKFFDPMWDFGWLAIPAYVWLGNIFFYSGLGAELYSCVNKWVGRLPGGLGIATTFSDALFGTISGSSMAACATIGPISVPAMLKAGYSESVATGCNASAGGLASMIPPSINMIVYANLALVSLGRMFFAGFIPGFFLAGLFSMYLFTRGMLTPKSVPRGEKFSWAERFSSLRALIPVLIVFLFIFGSLYSGFATPIEAGVLGCLGALVVTLGYRRLKLSDLLVSLLRTGSVCSMLFMIMVGAYSLNYFFFISGIQDALRVYVLSWHASPFWIVMGMMFVLIPLGMVLETSAMYMLTVPFFVPIITNLGIDPILFGIMMILGGEMAQITPPVGVNLFVINAVTGVPVLRIAWGTTPYVVILFLMAGILYFFPQIALWLPNTMWK